MAALLLTLAGTAAAQPDAAQPDAAQPELAQPPAVQPKDAKPPETVHREIGVLPLVGGDTDNGFGAGAIGSVAMFDPAFTPYRWQVQFGAFYATKGSVLSPSYEDVFAMITIPQMVDRKLRLEIRPSFTKDTALHYYGLGNAVAQPSTSVATRDFYERLHPALTLLGRWTIEKPWSVLGGFGITYNRISFSPDSTLAHDSAVSDPNITRSHEVVRFETGVVYDTRDNELAPNRGQYHQLKVRESPHLGASVPYSYQQVNATARFYVTLIPQRMVLALRGVVDVQFGNVPFYEQSRYEDTSAIGGGLGVRGVPAYSFYGKVKAFGNIELRTQVWQFRMASRDFMLGVATFFDAGRLWTEANQMHPNLDGSGLSAIHYGVGGGLRIQQGKAFLVRADLAWSPDARPVGAYLTSDHIF